MSEITNEGEDKVRRWKAAVIESDRCKRALNSAECEASNATNDLQKWLTPADCKLGEKFCVAYGKDFIQVEILDSRSCKLSLRPRV